MQYVTSDILTFRGNHYDYGVTVGKWLQQTQMLKNRAREWKKRIPRFDIDISETHTIFQQFAPSIWEEIRGIQEVLNIPTRQAILNFAHYRFTDLPDSGCTVYVGDNYLVRNYDYHPATYDGRYQLFQPNDGGYAQIGPMSRTTGRMDGMNEHGLVMAYNFMHRKKPANGFVCYMIGRLVLELCKDVAEAIQFLQTVPHRSSFSYILKDKSNNHAIVEVTPRGTKVRYDTTCTNHFKLLTHENRNYTQESKTRLEHLESSLANKTLNRSDVFKLFNDPSYQIYSKLFKSWSGTIHTSMYDAHTLTAWIALGENQDPIRIHFKDWLLGAPLEHSQFSGYIDTSISFASH
ncbi:C45 family autoproteolytic acyltransferase/hydolase [Staphylococcus felis]|uniref:C45 family autoproteolytic acyltransferase/hydolase n=1 Tax=Staphylococcus felis TaxID=46127 RepID=UPI000CD0531B|nr:C45 family autoproteolytic acyltransferase/hydolase [Staphylococcus felis]AVP37539.1 acyl-CoA--6-aminopenicillanic acid acyltransferase [Staphylococcus felis]PNZ37660.1 acyl-CoA--6-aminopenicillanic acid acyltransferase [Staphylococcus felis]QQB02513.1 acyl-CoA--6-aminopenicillanic acid acyltransferase [Staphylococcus felis]